MFPDVRVLPPAKRFEAAEQVRTARDFDLPAMAAFNSRPCRAHATVEAGQAQIPPCRRCGVNLRRHQRVGVAWLYLRGQGMIADQVGPQPLHAQVLTPTGYRRMGELAFGDEVIDPEGSLSVVTGVYPQGEQAVFRVTFSDGTWAESTLSHLWKVRGPIEPYLTRVGREPRSGESWRVRTLDEISKRAKPSAVPLMSRPPDFAEGDLPLDPYLLGLLLGDGCLSQGTPVFLSADSELLAAAERLRPSGWGWVFRARRTGCDSYAMPGSQAILRELGLYGHRAWEKFIPARYKWSSAKTRLALLQGLMDTDGNWASGSVEFCSTSETLAGDVADLARSLGLRASSPKRRITRYPYNGEIRQGRPSYRVSIAETAEVRVFRLERKVRAQPRRRVRGDQTRAGARQHWRRDQRVKWIRKIECVGRMPVQCISVSAPSQLYVTDNWTVTHNTGKTIQAAGLIAALAEAGEVRERFAVVVCKASAVFQWEDELRRLLPGHLIVTATGTKPARRLIYGGDWEVLVTGYQTFLNDVDYLAELPVGLLVVDDVDPLRNPNNRTSVAINTMAARCERVVVMTATPLQKTLDELYFSLEPVGGRAVLGTESQFRRKFIREEWSKKYSPHAGRMVNTREVVGYRNLAEFSALVSPMVLRRTAEQIDDVSLPAVIPNNVWLDLYPAQAARYADLRAGVLKILADGTTRIKQPAAVAKFLYGAQICAGLPTLGEADGPGRAVKLDWVMKALTGDLHAEKVVIFCQFKNTIRTLLARLGLARIGFSVIWGEDSDKAVRAAAVRAFWDDPACRVMLGTTAMESSLNLQVARHLINVDQIMNAARMTQLAGRIRRDGSAYRSVYVHNLLTRATQEESYLGVLSREQALADTVWSEESALYERLSPLALLQLIGHSGRTR